MIVRNAINTDAGDLNVPYFDYLAQYPPKEEQDMEVWRNLLAKSKALCIYMRERGSHEPAFTLLINWHILPAEKLNTRRPSAAHTSRKSEKVSCFFCRCKTEAAHKGICPINF